MANHDHIAQLKKGVAAWNAWRDANLNKANLSKAVLGLPDLSHANLRSQANFRKLYRRRAYFGRADLSGAILSGANLSKANLSEADLSWVRLRGANLSKADLSWASLFQADFSGADLSGADLEGAILIGTDFSGADLTGCRVHGISAWRLKLEGAKQQNLLITTRYEPKITVDNIEVAQFIYLMLNNQNIRGVIDTITSKAVLILGRFTDERKAVLDALRDELRRRNYLPILFDFAAPARRNITETVTLLARMARFIIADLTESSSIPQELQAIIPSVRVPVQPLLLEGSSLYSMFKDFDPHDYHWVLPVYQYKKSEQLLATLEEKVIFPAERKVEALEERRRMVEAELNKPQ